MAWPYWLITDSVTGNLIRVNQQDIAACVFDSGQASCTLYLQLSVAAQGNNTIPVVIEVTAAPDVQALADYFTSLQPPVSVTGTGA